MRDYIDPAIARIMRNGIPVGAGCLVRGRLLVTCAHVVSDALGLEHRLESSPDSPVDIEFAGFSGGGLKGVVRAWYPPSPSLADDGLSDIAVLVVFGDMGRAEPCHLLRRHDNHIGTMKAYGFPKDATQGSRHGEWLEAWAGDPLVGPPWFPLWLDDRKKQFIRPGYSGGPLVVWDGDYAGQVAGIVAQRKREDDGSYQEAWAIGSKALRKVLSTIDTDPSAYISRGGQGGEIFTGARTSVTAGVFSSGSVSGSFETLAGTVDGTVASDIFSDSDTEIAEQKTPILDNATSFVDLEAALGEISGICRRHLNQPSSNLPTDLLERIELLATALRRAKGSKGEPDLQRLVDYNERLVKAAAEAAREEVLELFETSPLRSVVDRLDALADQAEPSDRPSGDVRIDWHNAESETTKAARALDEEAKLVQLDLWSPDVNQVEARKRDAWHYLQDLRISIKEPEFSTTLVHQLRGKLEVYRINLLKRTLALSGCLLGKFAERLKPGTVFRDHEHGPEMVVIPPGSFLMGSPNHEEDRYDDESPQHQVTLTRSRALGRYPVTFEEYRHFCDATGRQQPADEGWGLGRRPVINVSAGDAEAYLAWLSEIVDMPYRLPSEAEWEYACRAGTTTPFWTGETISIDQANYGDGTFGSDQESDYRRKTTPVGSFKANPFGLYDVHGNVREWCADHWHDSYEGAPVDGSAWLEGGDASTSVVRSGSWILISNYCRSAVRNFRDRNFSSDNIGFRVVRTLGLRTRGPLTIL